MHSSNFEKILKTIASAIINFLLLLSSIAGLILVCIDLVYEFTNAITEPPVGLINGHKLYALFSLLLIIAIGYVLIKSMFNILNNNQVPVILILKIAIISISNKVIMLNLKEMTMQTMIGIAVIIASLSITFFLVQYKFVRGNYLDD
ncbi:MAG: phosphate-starvation-inducible PsiE family protein [Ferruginibacter sp.]